MPVSSGGGTVFAIVRCGFEVVLTLRDSLVANCRLAVTADCLAGNKDGLRFVF